MRGAFPRLAYPMFSLIARAEPQITERLEEVTGTHVLQTDWMCMQVCREGDIVRLFTCVQVAYSDIL